MKHLTALFLVAMLIFMGTGQLFVRAQEPVVLTLLTNWGEEDPKGAALRSVIADFEAEHSGITFDLEVIPDDTQIATRVETAFLAGLEPDIILHNYIGPSTEWVETGVTIPVTSFLEEWDFGAEFNQSALAEYTKDGELAAFPLEGFTWPVWYNMRILNEAGVEAIPQSAEELIQVADQVRAAGYQPFVTGGADWTGCRAWQLVLQSNMTPEEVREVFGHGTFAESESFLEVLDLFVQMRNSGVYADDVEGLDQAAMDEMFFSGQAAMMHAGSWSYAELPEELEGDVVLGGFPLPTTSPRERPVIMGGFDAKGLHITRNGSQKLEAIEQFVTFLYQPEMIARFVEQAAMQPPIMNVSVDESKLSPLFVQSIALDVEYVPTLGGIVPAQIFGPSGEFSVCSLAYVPGTTAEDILSAYNALYAPLQD